MYLQLFFVVNIRGAQLGTLKYRKQSKFYGPKGESSLICMSSIVFAVIRLNK